jgi:hypothetical protein
MRLKTAFLTCLLAALSFALAPAAFGQGRGGGGVLGGGNGGGGNPSGGGGNRGGGGAMGGGNAPAPHNGGGGNPGGGGTPPPSGGGHEQKQGNQAPQDQARDDAGSKHGEKTDERVSSDVDEQENGSVASEAEDTYAD